MNRQKMLKRKWIILFLSAALIFSVFCGDFTTNVYAATPKASVIKVGRTYKLQHAKYIYKGHGKKYGIKNRRELSNTVKKYAVNGIKRAKFKKGTCVTCLAKYKTWIKIPSGWIKYEKGDLKIVKKKRR